MQLYGTMEFKNESLYIGGCNTADLAKKYGTPLLVIDEYLLRENFQKFHRLLKDHLVNYKLFYAAKAFLSMGLCKIINEENYGLDVVSGGELYQAIAANFPAENIAMHGNNKSRKDILEGLDYGIGNFVVDNLGELNELESIGQERGLRIPILLRVVPSLKAKTHPYLDTGWGSKFGLAIEDGTAEKAMEIIRKSKYLKIKGLHSHLGSQITDWEIYMLAAKENLAFAETYANTWDQSEFLLNLGGGFAIAYQKNDEIFPFELFAQGIGQLVKAEGNKGKLPPITLELEPGRSIIGTAGTSLYTVGWPKRISDKKLIVPVDGGMADNIRPALYDAKYEGCLLGETLGRDKINSMIVGRLCESGDILIKELELPEARPGDLFAMNCTGAYTYAMSSNYNGLPRPAVILVNEGASHPLIRRETYKDLIHLQEIPAHLQNR